MGGLGKQGYGCKICYYPCHPKCLDLITEPCPGKKVKWGKKAIDNAKSKTVASPKDTVRKRGASRSDKEKEVDIIPSVDSDSEEEVVTTPKEKKMPNKLVSQPSLARISKGEIVEVAEKIEDVYDIGTEIVTGGELFDRIVSKGSYTEKDAAHLVKKFLEALDYLHDKDIVHRDLKPENLLLKSKDNDTDIKLAAFGLSKIVGQEVLM